MTMLYESEELRAAVLNARSAKLVAKTAGMVADNAQRAMRNESPCWTDQDFERAIVDCGLDDNGIVAVTIFGRAA